MKDIFKKYRIFVWLLSVVLVVSSASIGGFFIKFQNSIDQYRAKSHIHKASGDLVFIGIDKQSLDAVGVWPWPRSVYAEVIDKLLDLNVSEIGVDIDFSAASTPSQDNILRSSLEKAGGSVILPLFVQDRSAAANDNNLTVSKPIAEFEQHAWLASVNVLPDTDGLVRSFPYGILVNGEFIDSMPAVLSGVFGNVSNTININYSIDHNSIPSISVKDLLNGTVKPEALAGKTVLIGAKAVELRDNFVVPVHGILPGAIVQILAAETLKQNLQLTKLNPITIMLLLVVGMTGAMFFGLLFVSKRAFVLGVTALFATGLGIEILGHLVYQKYALILPSVESQILLISMLIVSVVKKLDLQNWVIKLVKSDLNNTQQMLDQVVTDSANAILIVSEEGKVIKANKQFTEYFNINEIDGNVSIFNNTLPKRIEDEIRGSIVALRLHDINDHRTGQIELDPTYKSDTCKTLEYTVTASKIDDREHSDQGDKYISCVTAWDITSKLAQEKRITYIAEHDELTGSLRRHEFEKKLDTTIFDTGAQQTLALFAVNLHRFKTVNINLGRPVGDQVLKETVKRLLNFHEDVYEICRLGGDKFIFSLIGGSEGIDLERTADELINTIGEPFHIGKAKVQVSLHVGIVVKINETCATELVANAETALDQAAKISGDAYVIHEDMYSEKQNFARSIESDLWSALDKNEIRIVYQPQVDLKTQNLIGVEALVRWQHSKRGFISPADFVAIAEANGFIDKLGYWVLCKACEDALLLPDHITVAVNVSPAQFMRTGMASLVRDVLSQTGLAAHRLHIEITEVGLLEALDSVVTDLKAIREMGVSLALDDFGTGFSSLEYFTNFPINKLKVDQTFVRTLERDSHNEAIIRSVRELCSGLDLKMICEGVETEKQLSILQEIGVDEGQGYLFGKPMPLQTILEFSREPSKLRA